MKGLRERVQGRGGREAGDRQEGKTEEDKNPLNFSQQQLRKASTHHSFPPSPPSSCTPSSHYFSPVLLSSENRPEARHSPGWLTPKQSPCSLHAANNLSLLKEPRLLEGSTRTPPPPPHPACIRGLLPRRRCSTRLHVPSPLPPRHPRSGFLPPDLPSIHSSRSGMRL